nr:MAG TPA: hypothetical protein [Caudoviricetes sp.]DAW51044.1 MAG TPA: hypothetical protein [Caudoviricetes sp.]
MCSARRRTVAPALNLSLSVRGRVLQHRRSIRKNPQQRGSRPQPGVT